MFLNILVVLTVLFRKIFEEFQNTEDKEYQRDVLYSFCKFKKLSKTAKQFLEPLSNSEFQDEVTKVLQDFHL